MFILGAQLWLGRTLSSHLELVNDYHAVIKLQLRNRGAARYRFEKKVAALCEPEALNFPVRGEIVE
jgi:hypothetical protein